MNVSEILETALGGGRTLPTDADDLATPIFGVGYPYVNAVCTVCRVGDVDRIPATLTVFMDDGGLSLCLRDRAGGRTCYASGDSFEDALTQLESDLSQGVARWRSASKRSSR